MNFLYPQFLYGLVALAIPVIIHLFNFRRTRRVYFSNTRFLQKVKEASSSKLKLKHYLILASRLLFIFFLVMAFAQPVLDAEGGSKPAQSIIIYLDNSFSMSNEVEDGITALDEALMSVGQLLDVLPGGTNYKLITNDFNPSSTVFKGKAEISEILTETGYSGTIRSVQDIQSRLDNEEGPYSVYWFSDFQQTSSTGNISDTVNQYNVLPLRFNSTKNVAVDSVYIENPLLIGNEKMTLNVDIKNYGEEEVNDLITNVYVDDIQVAAGSVDIIPGGTETITYDLAFGIDGVSRGRISFEEFPVTFDNEFYFVIDRREQINILEIKPDNNATYITNVYGNKELFNLKSISYQNLDYNLVNTSDLVVINGLDHIDPSLSVVLNEYVANGGSVCLVPGTVPDPDSYKQLYGLANLTLADSAIRSGLAVPDFDNPFFQNVFEERNPQMAMPEASQLLTWGMDRTAILNFKNGTAFLSDMATYGHLFIISSPLNPDYSNFQAHGLFVPVMYRMAVQSKRSIRKLYYIMNTPTIRIPADSLVGDRVYKLMGNDQEIIPSQRLVFDEVIMEVPKAQVEAGFYEVLLEDEEVSTLAFNYPFEESDLEQLGKEDISDLFQGSVTIFDADGAAGFGKAVENRYIGTPLWKLAIVLALVFLLVEVLLIRFFP